MATGTNTGIPRVTPRRNPGISGIAVTFAAVGAWLVYAGIRDINPVSGLGVLLRGEIPPSRTPGTPYQSPTGTGKAIGAAVGNSLGVPGAPVAMSETTMVGGIRVHTSIAGNVKALLDAAKADGITGVGGGGWRSTLEQQRLRLVNGCTCSNTSSCCSPPTAPVGKSMHERGLAIDFTQHGSIIDRNDPLFRWLTQNASKYGLKNLPSEPWHWSTTGS